MIILNARNIVHHHGANRVLNDVTFELQHDARLGLIGPNGAGKSTLLRVLGGMDTPTEGDITMRRGMRVGYLAQEPELPEGVTVLDEALKARESLAGMERQIAELEEQMGDPDVFEDEAKLQQVIDDHEVALRSHEEAGGLNLDGRVLSALSDLGFSDSDLLLNANSLSGGQKKLLVLARLAATQPELLLLDEPDNHLDLEHKRKLEKFIESYPGAVIIVSHDRYLLDVVAETIGELEVAGNHPGRNQLTVFKGNYSEYTAEKRLELARQQQSFELQQREITRLNQAARRLRDWSQYVDHNKFITRARSIERRIEKMDKIEKPVLEQRRIGLQFTAERGGFKVVTCDAVKKSFGDKYVLRGVDLLVTHGERVALLGENGAGKSVLLKIISGVETPDSGGVTIGARINVGYYSQEQETLKMDRSVVDETRSVKDMRESDAFAFLGSFLFDYNKARRKVGTLSGGEKARLQMAKLMLEQPNLLLMDEPTNNLDIPSCEALEDAIADYDGTVLAISHDRYFVERVTTREVELRDGRVTEAT